MSTPKSSSSSGSSGSHHASSPSISSKPFSSSSASVSKPGRKLTKAEQAEADRLEAEAVAAAAALAAIPPSPFDRIEEVWALEGQFEKQRALVGELVSSIHRTSARSGRLSGCSDSFFSFASVSLRQFSIEDGPGICIQSLTLDDTYGHLHFARTAGLNNAQTKVFFGIMQALKADLQQPGVTKESAFEFFKTRVLANSSVVRGAKLAESTAAITPAPVVPAISISVTGASSPSHRAGQSTASTRPGSSHKATDPSRPGSRGGNAQNLAAAAAGSQGAAATSSPNSARGKSGAVTPRTPNAKDAAAHEDALAAAAAAAAAAAEKPLLPKTFPLEMMKSITEYVTRTYFGHFHLTHAVFNPAHFRPRKNLLIERLLVETVVAVPAGGREGDLDQAVDLGALEEEQARKREYLEQHKGETDQKEEKTHGGRAEIWTRSESARSTRPPTASQQDPEPTDEISLMVKAHMVKARQQLQQLLTEHERNLDARVRTVEAKVQQQQQVTSAKSGGSAKKK
jgi:hypothetical protein